jgi:hypothetical protein
VRKSVGTPNIDAVEIGEVNVIVIGVPSPVISVKYALANAESGHRFGSGNMNTQWSLSTQEKFAAFVESLEADICGMVFNEAATTDGGPAVVEDTTDGIPSL